MTAALLLGLARGLETAPAGALSGGGFNWQMLLLFAGLIVVMIVLARMRKRAAGPPAGAAEGRRPPARPGEGLAREAVERLALDLEETARSVSALLDTKIHVLDKMLRDADARIARLEALSGQAAPEATPPPSEPEDALEAPPRSAADETLAHHARVYGLADQGLGIAQIAEETGCQRGEVELILSLRKIARPGKPGRT